MTLINFETLAYPLDWICLDCFATRVNEGTVTVTTDGITYCGECGDTSDSMYCQSCYSSTWDAGYESGQENAASYCNDCGNNTDDGYRVYCSGCAPDALGLIDLDEEAECHNCGDVTSVTLICESCFTATTQVVEAVAAEPFDVEWDT